jgi:glyoxylase-like metal-dependent hydrolase (beta-lactamase superfamily II)
VIFTPGHTDGECVFLFPDRRLLLTGDALVTLDPYTGFTGPRIVARAGTKDSRQALDSLAGLRSLDADLVLPGHGSRGARVVSKLPCSWPSTTACASDSAPGRRP